MRIVSIVGARPQFVKLAPVSRVMGDIDVTGGVRIEDVIIHTGQHYDAGMSDVFFEQLHIPKPSVHLNVGSGSHGVQTARMLESIEAVLLERKPDMVVIYGDTNSTLAGALAAAKLHIPICHIEAGLRSFNREMPEEINRIVSDHVSNILLAPTETAMKNLSDENLSSRAYLTGDVMLDAVLYNSKLAEQQSTIRADLSLVNTDYAVATLHRPSNTEPEVLRELLETFNKISRDFTPIVFPIHPRTSNVIKDRLVDWKAAEGLKIIEPLGYLDMLDLLGHARFAMTDSGGLQKEALFLGTPCITLREETEWPETVESGGNVLAGAEPERILEAARRWTEATRSDATDRGRTDSSAFGQGDAATRIVQRIVAYA